MCHRFSFEAGRTDGRSRASCKGGSWSLRRLTPAALRRYDPQQTRAGWHSGVLLGRFGPTANHPPRSAYAVKAPVAHSVSGKTHGLGPIIGLAMHNPPFRSSHDL
jgi:hypothetical protein